MRFAGVGAKLAVSLGRTGVTNHQKRTSRGTTQRIIAIGIVVVITPQLVTLKNTAT
jgi:hypothetical protein